jgi:hypothetical protein
LSKKKISALVCFLMMQSYNFAGGVVAVFGAFDDF